jgi:RNA polymerase primary sigma factor
MTKQKTKKADQAQRINSDENILSLYLKELSRIPLLTREEEEDAARKAVQGDVAARNKLASANLRFVVSVAKKFQGRGLPLPDLISEGNIGLMNAIERFDADKGYHFISYAVWWIRQAMFKAICEKSKMIKQPSNRVNDMIQIEKARDIVQGNQSLGEEIREIAGFLDMESCYVTEIINLSRDPISLDNPINSDIDSATLGDFIEDDNYIAPEEYAVTSALQGDLEAVLRGLDRREADILRFRYGLNERGPMSLEEIGERYHLTKERVRQLEIKALKGLQAPSRQKRLESYVA